MYPFHHCLGLAADAGQSRICRPGTCQSTLLGGPTVVPHLLAYIPDLPILQCPGNPQREADCARRKSWKHT